ncbi:MAG: FMN-binding negative transcriptional regulator [Rhodoferax sp.]
MSLYLPRHFEATDRQMALDLMRSHPLGSLVSNDDDGFPFVTHVPLHLEERGEALVLHGHCARPNPHWQYLQARPQALVTFMGPQAYLSPKVYPDLVRVPTWNYLAVHCQVQARLLHAPEPKDRLLKNLIRDHDPAYEAQWRGLQADYQQRMLGGIVAFELEVVRLQCKVKMNQHRPEAFGGMRAAYAQQGDNGQALLRWMDRLGMGAPAPESAAPGGGAGHGTAG